jgi:hypothetical protein
VRSGPALAVPGEADDRELTRIRAALREVLLGDAAGATQTTEAAGGGS